MLRGIASIVSELLRSYDAVGRIGGDEFLIVVPIEEGRDHVAIFDRLCTGIANCSFAMADSRPLSVTVSMGVARADGTKSANQVLAAADLAMYRAKHQGRNCVVYAA